MRLIYSQRREELVETIRNDFNGFLTVSPAQAGMNVIGWLTQNNDDVEVSNQLQEHGILCAPMSVQSNKQTSRNGLLL